MMLLRQVVSLCFLAVLTCWLPMESHAQKGPTLNLLGDASYAPYSFLYGGRNKGIDVEVVEELGVRLDIPIRIELVDRAELLRRVAAGECDGVLAMRPTVENKERALMLRSHPLHVSTYSAFLRHSARFPVAGLDDLYGHNVGVLDEVHLGMKFQAAVKRGDLTVSSYANPSLAIGALLKGQIEAFIGQTKATHHLLDKMGMTNTIQAEGKPLIKRGGEYLALLKSSSYPEKEALLKFLELAIADIFADGTYRKIVHRYVL